MSQAYDQGVQTALAELEEMFGEEVMEKVAGWNPFRKATRMERAKGWLSSKYKAAKKHVGKHSGKYGLGAGAAAGGTGMYMYDRS